MKDAISKKVWSMSYGGVTGGNERSMADLQHTSNVLFVFNPNNSVVTLTLEVYAHRELLGKSSFILNPQETVPIRLSEAAGQRKQSNADWTGLLVASDPVVLEPSYRTVAQFENERHSLFAFLDQPL